ncbi:MAG: hypothetical protein K0U98_05640 [Deltaproteobacteria bacterium]|nr:hypothetical protein [Deltaproteobacteria bacterium]
MPEAISQDPGACVAGAVALGLAGRYPEILDELNYKTSQELYTFLWVATGMDPKGTSSEALLKGKVILNQVLNDMSKEYIYFLETTILIPGTPRDKDKPNDPNDPNLNWVAEVDRVMKSGGVVELGLTLPGGEAHCALLVERPLPRNDGGAGLIFADDPSQSDGKPEIKKYGAVFSKSGKSLSEAAYWLDYIALETLTKKRKPVSSGGGKGSPDSDGHDKGEDDGAEGQDDPEEDDPTGKDGKKEKDKKERRDDPRKKEKNKKQKEG